MPGTAWLFPGQGAQQVGMGQDLAAAFPAAGEVFALADAALGRPLSSVIFAGPEDELTRTANTQPAILVTSVACLVAGRETGALAAAPSWLAGHSLGEYSALVAAEALELEDAIRLVQERGRLMQAACDATPSTMAALIGLEEDAVAAVCAETGAELCNINTGTQIVVGGRETAVEAAMALAQERGARRAVRLKVNGAFHSSLMASAAAGMQEALSGVTLRAPATPVLGNVTARPLESAEAVREELGQQVRSPVRWRASIEAMLEAGAETFVEIGPGSALTGMVRAIARERGGEAPRLVNLHDVASVRASG